MCHEGEALAADYESLAADDKSLAAEGVPDVPLSSIPDGPSSRVAQDKVKPVGNMVPQEGVHTWGKLFSMFHWWHCVVVLTFYAVLFVFFARRSRARAGPLPPRVELPHRNGKRMTTTGNSVIAHLGLSLSMAECNVNIMISLVRRLIFGQNNLSNRWMGRE